MIAHVVPITRLRRDTTWWSYRIPRGKHCTAGSLVSIPFRGVLRLGVVWAITEEADTKATKEVVDIFTVRPLLKQPHRTAVEYLSLHGLCSLSTALHVWMPSFLRELPLSKETLSELSTYDSLEAALTPHAQHCVLVPSIRPTVTAQLKERFKERTGDFFGEDAATIRQWFATARGEISLGIGRERALFAPWANLRHLTIIDPEDISYYHEQIPYLSLVDMAVDLAETEPAGLELRSRLPETVLSELWGKSAQGTPLVFPEIELIDLHRNPLINPYLVSRISATLAAGHRVIILLNAHDRVATDRRVLPGIETTAKRLATALGYETLPELITLGTRSIFQQSYDHVGLCIVLSLDFLINQTTFANIIHGFGDLGHLASYGAPCIIQTRQSAHPLVTALVHNKGEAYLRDLVAEQQKAGLPPFGEYIAVSLPSGVSADDQIQKLYTDLISVTENPWRISHPFETIYRKRPYVTLFLHAPASSRVPLRIRRILVGLPRPWKVQRNPWHLL